MTLTIHGSPDQRQAFKDRFSTMMAATGWQDDDAGGASSITVQDAPNPQAVMAQAFLAAMKGLCEEMASETGVSLEWS